MKHKTVNTTWDVRGYQVWGNSVDGYEVNDTYVVDSAFMARAHIETYNAGTLQEFNGAELSDYQIKRAFGVSCAITVEGDDTHYEISRASDYYPIGSMYCTSHYSLSPIRVESPESITP